MNPNINLEQIMEVSQLIGNREQAEKLERFRVLNQDVKKHETLFVGSSLMEQFPINELLMTAGSSMIVYNRGIGGFKTDDMLRHMEEMVFALEPKKIFINIGTNDIASPEYSMETLMSKYEEIIRQIQERLPAAEILMMAYYPINEYGNSFDETTRQYIFGTRTNENILLANVAVASLAKKMGCQYIDVNDGLTDKSGRLKKEYTVEGIHMYANGYRVVLNNLEKYL